LVLAPLSFGFFIYLEQVSLRDITGVAEVLTLLSTMIFAVAVNYIGNALV